MTLTHLTLGENFDQLVNNLSLNIKEIKIFNRQTALLKKIPFECKIVDEKDIEIFL